MRSITTLEDFTPLRALGWSWGRSVDPRKLWASVVAGLLVSSIVSYRMATQSLVLGSLDGHWVYKYVRAFHMHSIEVVLWTLAVCGVVYARPRSMARRVEWWVVLAWLLVGFGLQAQLRTLSPYTVEQMFVSDEYSFYAVTQQYSAGRMIREFDRLRSSLPTHARSNMPGKLMLVYALERVSRRPGVVAWLVIVVSDVGGILFYIFVRDLFDDPDVALIALVLYLFLPAKLFFFPVLNTATPTVALVLACLWQRWLRTQAARYALLSGIALYGLLFYDPVPLVLGVWFAAFTLRAVSRAELAPKTLLLHVGGGLLVFVTTDVAVRLWFGFDLIATIRHVGADGMAFNETHRPYAVWVWRNLADFFFGVGICQAVLFAAAVGYAICRIAATGRIDDDPIGVVSLGLAVLVVILDVLGVNRGEVIRLWIFLACFLQIPAAYICVRLNNRLALMSILGATLLQAGLGTAMLDFGMP